MKPLTTQDLRHLIVERIARDGQECDLNDIDISAVSNFSQLFKGLPFRGDISRWNVSHVTNMHEMFYQSVFTGDISRWNVSRVRDMSGMFERSQFNSDISAWDVSSVKSMASMFNSSIFTGDLSAWNVSNVENFSRMFFNAAYASDLEVWRPNNAKTMETMFWDSSYGGTFSTWRPSESCNTDYFINPLKMGIDGDPSFYHFQLMYTQRNLFHATKWVDFVNQHRPILDGMGMTPMQAGLWLHAQWFEGPTVNSDLCIPNAVFDNLV